MLGFIPMNDTATVYSQTEAVDNWGQPIIAEAFTAKCQINYNTDLVKISGLDGVETVVSATIVFHKLVHVTNGDFVEFTTDSGIKKKHPVVDVFFFKDWASKVVATRVVIGNGKRS